MSTKAESMLCDGMYSKLIDNESSYFDEADLRGPDVQRHSVLVPVTAGPPKQSGPEGPRQTGPAPRAYRLATVCLATLCAVLLVSIIAVSAHYNSLSLGPGVLAPQKQPADVSALTEALARLRAERDQLLQERGKRLLGKAAPALNFGQVPETPAPTQPAATPTMPTATPGITCPPRWLLFNTSCYFISTFTRDWAESQSYCQENGAHLAIIHTAEEQSFVWEQLPRGHWNAYWFGISDETTEADWLWVDGTTLVGGFWEEGEPNNHIDEDCGYIVKTRKRERVAVRSWYDAPCSMYWPFICEKEMNPQ